MAGGYISCGSFCGDDKSGSAFSGVLKALLTCVPVEQRDDFATEVLDPLATYFEDCEDHYLIEPDMAAMLLAPVELLFAQYGDELGHPKPIDAIEFEEVRGVSPIDAKWGDGIGWRYYCLNDLRIALKTSIESDEPVLVHFD